MIPSRVLVVDDYEPFVRLVCSCWSRGLSFKLSVGRQMG